MKNYLKKFDRNIKKDNSGYDIILFGGDRILEKRPFSSLSIFLKKKKLSYISIINPSHAIQRVDKNENLKQHLIKKKINFIIKDKLNHTDLKKLINKETFGLSINSRWKFSKKIIKIFNGKLFNYHAGDLPTERGAGTVTWRIILKKKNKISINIHEINEGFDTGKILKQKKISIKKLGVLPSDHLIETAKIEDKFIRDFVEDFYKKKKFIRKKQDNNESYYWPRLNSDKDGEIDWNWTAEEIVNFIKSFSKPYNGSFSYLAKKKVRILNASFQKSRVKFHSFQNGIIFRLHQNFFYIANRDYVIKIHTKDFLGLKKNYSYYLGKRLYKKINR